MRKAFREFMLVAVPKALGGFGTVLLTAALMRYFDPAQYALFSLSLTVIVFVDGTLGSAIDAGIVRLAPLYHADNPSHALSIQRAALYLKSGAALVIGLAAVIIDNLSAPGANGAVSPFAVAAAAALVAVLLLRSAQAHLQVEGEFTEYGLLDLAHHVVKFAGVGLVLLAGAASPAAILLMFFAAPLLVFGFWAAGKGRYVFSPTGDDLRAGRELVSYVKWFLLSTLVTTFVARADTLLLTTLSDIGEVGVFLAAQSFALIFQLLGSYMAVVLSPRVIPYWRGGTFYQFFKKFQLVSLLGCLAIFAFVRAGSDVAAALVLPPTYARSHQIFLILLPGALAWFATFPLAVTFLMFVRPRFLIVVDGATFPLMVLLYLYLIPRHGAVGAAWVTSVFGVAKAVVAQVAVARTARRQAGGEGETNFDRVYGRRAEA